MADSLKPGDEAPDFTLPRDGGGTVSLSEFQGRPVVLYFYPKDDTPGCTKEAIGFTEKKQAFDEIGAVIIGVSKDSAAKHDKFKDKHGLSVILAADEETDVIQKYGVWVEKNMYGRKTMGTERATFLIDPEGRIAEIWRKVKVPGHVDAVLARAHELAPA